MMVLSAVSRYSKYGTQHKQPRARSFTQNLAPHGLLSLSEVLASAWRLGNVRRSKHSVKVRQKHGQKRVVKGLSDTIEKGSEESSLRQLQQ